MTEGGAPIGTLIFRILRWHDRSEILKGARQAYPVKCTQDNVTLLFFPDFSPATMIRRKAFNPVLKKMTALSLQPFLIYLAVIKLRHKGEQMSFDSPQKTEDFISSLSQQKTYAAALREGGGRTAAAVSPARWEGLDGRDGGGSAAQEGMMTGWTWKPEPVFCFFFYPFSYWDIVPIYPVQQSLYWSD